MRLRFPFLFLKHCNRRADPLLVRDRLERTNTQTVCGRSTEGCEVGSSHETHADTLQRLPHDT